MGLFGKNTKTNAIELNNDNIYTIITKNIKEETFSEEYVQAVQKIDGAEAQKSIREYQKWIMVIKIATKITFAVNMWKLMDTIRLMGFSAFIEAIGGIV